MRDDIMFSWERLPIYEQLNDFARLLGELLAAVPTRLQIEVHQLIGQTMAMTNAVPGAYRDVEPGDRPVAREERRAWLMIGFVSAKSARSRLKQLRRTAQRLQPECAVGIKLLNRIEAGFQEGLDSLDSGDSVNSFV